MFPTTQVACQQLHNYPVGPAGEEHAPECFGQKYNIQFGKREFLTNLSAAIALDTDEGLLERVRRGVIDGADRPDEKRGVIFLGDRDFEASHVSVTDEIPSAYWYRPIKPDQKIGDVQHSTYLTVRVNRADSSKTISKLFCPISKPSPRIPAEAWQDCSGI